MQMGSFGFSDSTLLDGLLGEFIFVLTLEGIRYIHRHD
jgi:hypothetical protein